uniref:Transport inhibitor response 1 domain-containing protein n=1 Tax=Solanum lycopersicum TaxID=4081 RepID=A0A3Q7GMZ7_SOLLC
MTNDALVTIARNRPNMIRFRLCIIEPQTPDYLILEPLDAGDSDLGLLYVLSGCESLRKLEIRDCPFGDEALLANAAKLESGDHAIPLDV